MLHIDIKYLLLTTFLPPTNIVHNVKLAAIKKEPEQPPSPTVSAILD
jgi:hypothetical protein